MIETYLNFGGSPLLQWAGTIVILLLFWGFLFKTKSGESYRRNLLSMHIRSMGLIMLVFSLVYFSFFVDRTRLTADADIKRVTLDNEVTYLGNIIPSINDELSILSTNLGELQAIYGGDYDRREIIAKISNAESRIRDLYKQTDDVIARMLLDSLNPSIFVSNLSSDDKIDIAQRMSALDTGLREISENKEMLDVIFSNKAHELKVAKAKLAILKDSNHIENIYFAMRALSLGGLGALVTLLTSYMLVAPSNGKIDGFMSSNNYWSLLLAHTAMGSIVSTVIFGLFYTKQLTIFQPENNSTEYIAPEFWRVTMLCIIAGAFAEKLYSAASNRVDLYVDEPNKKNQADT